MSQQVQELINKIKAEGLQAAQDKATQLERDAQKKAEGIIAEAQKKADQIVASARDEAKKLHESTQASLKQSSRDVLISVRKEIEALLKRILAKQVSDTLTAEHLTHVITDVVQKTVEHHALGRGIQIALNPNDLKKLKDGALAKLQHKIKEGITFHAAQDISKGLTISFDGGKSSFDFSENSLADYLSTHLSPEIAALMQSASKA
jgi:V/A-type H+-transporting ATPase subunit E